MALDDTALKSSILGILDGTVSMPNVAAAGDAWGDAYANYASAGTVNVPTIPATVTPASITALKGAMTAALSTLPGVPGTVAGDMTTAFGVFWGAVLFGAITPVPTAGATVLTTTLTNIFIAIGGTHDGKATAIRDALSIYTKAVVATFPMPGPPPPGIFGVV